MNRKAIIFFKTIGGDVYCVKVAGKWHYVGNTVEAGIAMQNHFISRGYAVKRALGMPRIIADKWQNVKALKRALPSWNEINLIG